MRKLRKALSALKLLVRRRWLILFYVSAAAVIGTILYINSLAEKVAGWLVGFILYVVLSIVCGVILFLFGDIARALEDIFEYDNVYKNVEVRDRLKREFKKLSKLVEQLYPGVDIFAFVSPSCASVAGLYTLISLVPFLRSLGDKVRVNLDLYLNVYIVLDREDKPPVTIRLMEGEEEDSRSLRACITTTVFLSRDELEAVERIFPELSDVLRDREVIVRGLVITWCEEAQPSKKSLRRLDFVYLPVTKDVLLRRGLPRDKLPAVLELLRELLGDLMDLALLISKTYVEAFEKYKQELFSVCRSGSTT